jgi:glycosyltransferase involved in cell wall biosynthesis
MVYGGASLGTLHLAERVDPEVFHSTIVCGFQSENEGDLSTIMRQRNVDVVMIPEMVREINLRKDFVTFLKLVALFKKHRYTIVHAHGSKAGTIGRLAAAIARVPVILYTVHGWGLKAGAFMPRVFFRFVERGASYFTTSILFQTQSDIQEAERYGIGSMKQYVWIGNGIDLQSFTMYDKERSMTVAHEFGIAHHKIVGTVGRVSEQKNPVGFVSIAKRVLQVMPGVIFVFVGGGELLHRMRTQVKQEGFEKKILFIGPRDDVAEIMSHFDVFVLPSLWEGLPRSVLEAMALSKPVVVHDIGGIREVVDNNNSGFIVPFDKYDTFADKICQLLSDERLRLSMGRLAGITAQKYDFKQVIRRTETIYSKSLSEVYDRK